MEPIIPKYSNHLTERLCSSYLTGLHYKLHAGISVEKNHVYWRGRKHLYFTKMKDCYLCRGVTSKTKMVTDVPAKCTHILSLPW